MSFDIIGNYSYRILGDTVTVEIDQVRYNGSGVSGSVRFELWATQQPYSGGGLSGYRIADYRPSGDTLQSGQSFVDIEFSDDFNIPDGGYYLTLAVTEYNGAGNNNGFTVEDAETFNNSIRIGEGGDNILGTNTADFLEGTNRDDSIFGYGGGDTLYGYGGNDRLFGGPSNDTLGAGSGNDLLKGGRGDDLLSGYDGRDVLYGEAGNDNLGGNNGNDVLIGGPGDDYLFGDIGRGAPGSDVLFGGRGSDTCKGGAGADIFRFKAVSDFGTGRFDRDSIADFSRSEGDTIDLSEMDASWTQAGNQQFKWIGGAQFHGKAGELRFGSGLLSGDVDGDRRADFFLEVEGSLPRFRSDFDL